ncbi:MAG: dTDP-4-dehydrorhamnose 3,5-epimerase [Ignavibacteriaceae bacterium]|nr:dTDP-4-dehydrorhamnose 3,5-epimerase [Ignavibacteriaceae bacterium]
MLRTANTNIDGLLLIYPEVYNDKRGYFQELYNQHKYNEIGIKESFVQHNISKSVKNTIRGLHFQKGENAQGKLCQVLTGKVLDVCIDIRKESATFKNIFKLIIAARDFVQIWMPPGIAHGFSVLSDEAIFSYKCTKPYNHQSEGTILFNDSDLNIDWMVENPIVSGKDLMGISFNKFVNGL